MLVYHPAFDLYHGVFRVLKLLNRSQKKNLEIEKLRLLDFYLLFPGLIPSIRLKREHQKYKRIFTELSNKYNIASVSGQAKQVFERIEPFNNLILTYLENKKYVKIHEETYLDFFSSELPKKILEICNVRDEKENKLMGFLSEVLSSYELKGADGLKARTGLMEYRYDNI